MRYTGEIQRMSLIINPDLLCFGSTGKGFDKGASMRGMLEPETIIYIIRKGLGRTPLSGLSSSRRTFLHLGLARH